MKEGWTSEPLVRLKARAGRLLCRSPRGDGCFAVETIAMPADMGAFTVERLRSMAERASRGPWRDGEAKTSDETSWTAGGVVCVGRSLSFQGIAPPSAEEIERLMKEPAKSLRVDAKEIVRRGSSRTIGPRVRRDWWLARGTDMANAWYDSKADDAVAADLADCEEMLRSIRFDAGT
jgi:hypothetical protein